MNNIRYSTKNLPNYFSQHRKSWAEFYPSERKTIEYVAPAASAKVLDMGCACGGLALALNERFGVHQYLGVDIHADAISAARDLVSFGKFIADDFLDAKKGIEKNFDLAFSLSCADWNVKTEELFVSLFEHVKPGGHMIFSCRLTRTGAGILQAQQKIEYPGATSDTAELAPYKVYSLDKMLALIGCLTPAAEVYGFGYWGNVPETVQGLPIKQAFYAVFAVQKALESTVATRLKLDVALDLLNG